MTLNTQQLSSELVRALRGRRSQPAFSRRLGYATNVVHTWEAGTRSPTAGDFFRAAARSGVDVDRAIAQFFRGDQRRNLSSAQSSFVASLLEALRGDARVGAVARSTKATRLTVTRWLRGTSEPRLPQLLDFVQATTQRLLDFVAVFTDPGALASTRSAWRDHEAQLRVAYDLPWSHAVLRALELSDYRRLPHHQPGFLATRLGIAPEIETRALEALAAARQIRKVRGKWTATRVLTVDTRPDAERNLELKRHWARVGVERLGGDGLFSYNLFSVSDEHYVRLLALHRAYFEQVRALVAESKTSDRVALMNVQLFALTK